MQAHFDPPMMHSTRARQALARLPEVDPAIAALALWCTYRDANAPTKTIGETVYIGPEFPLLPISEQTGLLAHHVLHVALRHSARRAAARERYGTRFQSDIYDLTCDALINEALLQGNHALPRPAVRASDLVAMLPDGERPKNILAEWDSDTLYMVLVEKNPPSEAVGKSEINRYAQSQGFTPDLGEAAPDAADADIWAARVTEALRAGQQAGSGIGTVMARFGDLPKAVTPWEIHLRRLLNKAFSPDVRLNHRRPARAWLAREALARQQGGPQPVFEPGQSRDARRPRLVIGLDTSSSINAATLDLFAAETISLVRRTGAEAHLLGFDTEVHSRTRFAQAASLVHVMMRRGGGTDYDAVLSEAEALDPSLVVILTDLDALTRQAPASPVLWAVPREPKAAPAFGDVLIMSDAV